MTYKPDLRCKHMPHGGTTCHKPATGVKLWVCQQPDGYLAGKTLYAPRCDEHAQDSHEPLDSGRALGFWVWERNDDTQRPEAPR